MATHAPLARVPFAPLDNPRLQHLASAKNRQNGLFAQKSTVTGKPSLTSFNPILSPTKSKRSYELFNFDDENVNSENVDPSTVSTSPSNKKSKSHALDNDTPVKPFTFSLAPSAKAMPPPPTRMSTPIRANMSSPRTPSTAPAGRSPKRSNGIAKSRRTSAPFTRIDPPLSLSRNTSTGLPFSLDAALDGTFSKSTSSSTTTTGATIQESLPKSWFFDIYVDTLEEEAANLMEHSTLTLDLSSDEEGRKKERSERGKENVAPEGYDAYTASRSPTVSGGVAAEVAAPAVAASTATGTKINEIIRRKILAMTEMDDGERSPLSNLETEFFFAEGLQKDSCVVVPGTTPEKKSLKLDVTEAESTVTSPTAIVGKKAKVEPEIVVWEDESSPTEPVATPVAPVLPTAELNGTDSKKVLVVDENNSPAAAVTVVVEEEVL